MSEQMQQSFCAQIKDISHKYKDKSALDDLTLEFPKARLSGLIGPDGVGKSTLLSLIAGAKRIQKGAVLTLGADMRSASERSRVYPKLAFMPQGLGSNLYPDLSVHETLTFFSRLYGQDKELRNERIDTLLQATGLDPFAHRKTANLSGGMKQKLGLCCALVHDPDLLILDEPTTGVDPLSRRQFWHLIDSLRHNQPHISILVATAYMEEAEAFDHLVLMDNGQVIATGSPQDIQDEAQTRSLEEAYITLSHGQTVQFSANEDQERALKVEERKTVIEAKGLTKKFGSFTAVDHVEVSIKKGEIFGFLGPNGSGKTTTMKMLTGLIPPTSGDATLFGRPLEEHGKDVRRRIGYMSQSFSLYRELTVLENLRLHARLFGMTSVKSRQRIDALLRRFDLENIRNTRAADLPLGQRQRLSLAVAIIHEPDLLILDEPTSGVDPSARNRFWELLFELSRHEGVTIFLSTHFMNEAERCDRVSFMEAGKILAYDTPQKLIQNKDAQTLKEAFIAYLEESGAGTKVTDIDIGSKNDTKPKTANSHKAQKQNKGGNDDRSLKEKALQAPGFRPSRLFAYARREVLELSRDWIRLSFAVFAPIFLLVILGFGISLDVNDIPFAVLDHDRTPQSRKYVEEFQGSRYFREKSPIVSYAELEKRLQSGELKLAIEIPPGFGRRLFSGEQPQIGMWIDGGMPFRAETIRGYSSGVESHFIKEVSRSLDIDVPAPPYALEARFRYNQAFKSLYAFMPGTIAMLLIMIPSMLTAVAVVREKELGSIVNLYVTPVKKIEFLLGKQLPYIVISCIGFLLLFLVATLFFSVPFKGSFSAILFGAFLYVSAATGIGLLVSVFTRSQIAALLAAEILTIIPAIQFSGQIRPVSSLEGGAAVMGWGFPASYFHKISVGTFTKALGWDALMLNYFVLAGFAVGFTLLSLVLLRKQER